MKLRAILDNGRLTFEQPVRLRHEQVSVHVIIPDPELVEPDRPFVSEKENETELETGKPTIASLRRRLDEILGVYAKSRPEVTRAEDREHLIDWLTHRHQAKRCN